LHFGELTERHFKHSQLLTLDELDDRMRSISVIATRCFAVCVVPPIGFFALVRKH